MDTPSRGVGCRPLTLLVMLALFVGVLGGGAAGGAAALYFGHQTPAVSLALPAAQPASQTNVTLKADTAIVDAVKKAEPAVVTIINTLQAQRVPSVRGQPRTQQGQAVGTGIIIDAQGYIVTNNHVIENAQKLEVLFANGDKADAKLIGADPFADLAVVQVTGRTMPAVAELGDSDSLQVGEPVIAIGSALGDFKNTVTVGVVSALNRQLSANESSVQAGLIQTDAAINHGNSGGPLLNAEGQVIGINTLVIRTDNGGDVAEGLGFAIPVSTVKFVTAQLLDKGKVARPFLGVSYQMITPQIAAANNLSVKAGALIQDVTANGPAARAGMKVGDVITAVGGATLGADSQLAAELLKHHVGEAMSVDVLRNGQTVTLSVTLGERPAA